MKFKLPILLGLFILLGFNKLNGQTPSLTLCKGKSINYSQTDSSSSLPSVSWFWTFQGGDIAASTKRYPSVTYNTVGLFKTTCTSTFVDSSKNVKTIYVLIIDGSFTNIPIRDTTICSNSIVLTLDAGNNYPINRFVWSSPNAPVSAKDTFSQLKINQEGIYSVKITNICGTSSKSVTIKKGIIPAVNLGGDLFVCHNISLILNAGFVAGYTYVWTPTLEKTAQITAALAGTYKVTVTSQDGCSTSDDVTLIDSCPPVVWLPNAFTPNDANPNNIYQPYLEGFKSLNMRIYNRWGEKMFETSDLNGGWDGFYMGKPALEGVYICMLELVGNDSYRKLIKTNFHLIR